MTKCYILINSTTTKKKLTSFFENNKIEFATICDSNLEQLNIEDVSNAALFIDSENLIKIAEFYNFQKTNFQSTILIQNISDNITTKKHTKLCELIINPPLSKVKLEKTYDFINKYNILEINNKNVDSFDYGEYFLQGTSQILGNFNTELKNIAKTQDNIFLEGSLGTEKIRVLNHIVENVRAKSEKIVYLRCKQVMKSDAPKKVINTILKSLSNNSEFNELLVIYQPYHLDEEAQNILLSLLTEKQNIQSITVSQYSPDVLINEFNFKKDLIALLTNQTIKIPVLVNRKHDIPHIVDYLTERLISIYGCQDIKFSTTALITLQSYEWPGNYTELRNIIESLLINAVENQMDIIESKDLPSDLFIVNQASLNPSVNYDIMSKDLKEARSIFEKQYIEAQIRRFGGNVSHTANFIGMERTALHRKLSYLGIMSDDLRSSIKGYKRSSSNS
jgi:transcriptional regulator of acetoin/glycerol metabolism